MNLKKFGQQIALPLIFLFASPAGSACGARTADRDNIYISAPFVGLQEGILDGEVTVADLKRHGDIGIGAVNAMDGELVMVDGRCYQVSGDGKVRALDDTEMTPFSVTSFFRPETEHTLTGPTDFAALRAALDRILTNPNMPATVRVRGTFTSVKTRSVHRKARPYPRLIDFIRTQSEFALKNVTGSAVGFRMPDFVLGIGTPGYHFHFLTEDRTAGGHLLDFTAENLTVETDTAASVLVSIPKNSAFRNIRLSPEQRAELERILGRAPAPKP